MHTFADPVGTGPLGWISSQVVCGVKDLDPKIGINLGSRAIMKADLGGLLAGSVQCLQRELAIVLFGCIWHPGKALGYVIFRHPKYSTYPPK